MVCSLGCRRAGDYRTVSTGLKVKARSIEVCQITQLKRKTLKGNGIR
jgi:hypothetical protein